MKRTITRIFSLFLSTLLLFSIVSVAHASTRASDFFAVTEVWATPQGNGKFIVEFDIGATHKMSELGAKQSIFGKSSRMEIMKLSGLTVAG